MHFILSPIGLVLIGLLGMLIHFMKKDIKGETTTEIRDYFRDHFKDTFIATVVTIIGVLSYKFQLATGQFADVVTVFGLGYTFDSMFNKWDNKPIVKEGGINESH